MLYEVAVLLMPTKKQEEEGEGEKLVFGPKAIVASSPQTAGLLIGKDAALEGKNPDLLKVLIRPFAKEG